MTSEYVELALADQARLLFGTTRRRMYLTEDGESQLFLPRAQRHACAGEDSRNVPLLPYADGSSIAEHPIFYRDERRTFFVAPDVFTPFDVPVDGVDIDPGSFLGRSRQRACWARPLRAGRLPAEEPVPLPELLSPTLGTFVRELNRKGVDGLLHRDVQMHPETRSPALQLQGRVPTH